MKGHGAGARMGQVRARRFCDAHAPCGKPAILKKAGAPEKGKAAVWPPLSGVTGTVCGSGQAAFWLCLSTMETMSAMIRFSSKFFGV